MILPFLKGITMWTAVIPAFFGGRPAIPPLYLPLAGGEAGKNDIEKTIKSLEDHLAGIEKERKELEDRTDGDYTKRISRLRNKETLIKREIVMQWLAMRPKGRAAAEERPFPYMPVVPRGSKLPN